MLKVVEALAMTLEPIGDVDVDAAMQSEVFDCLGPFTKQEGSNGGCRWWVLCAHQD